MAILGNIVKSVVEWSGSFSQEAFDSKHEQEEVLKDLLNTAKNTSFGQYHGFYSILDSSNPFQSFVQEVPIYDYETFNRKWLDKQRKFGNVTWPKKQKFYALTSGTTGKSSKRIPVSDQMLDNTRKVSYQVINNLLNFDLKASSFEREVLMLGSSNDLKKNELGFLEGEISGINTYNFPNWFDVFYRPGKEIAMIDDWDLKVNEIVKAAPNWDVSVMAGIPSWIQLTLQAIIKEYNLKSIHDIWPGLELYITGGVAFDPFEKGFDRITERKLKIIDTYLASEGFFGFTDDLGREDMKLSLNTGIFYEFLPFNGENFKNGEIVSNPQSMQIGEVEEGEEYALLVSTCSGLWRYLIGDTLKFTDKKNARFKLTGRTKFFLNVVGSQLSEEKLNHAINHLAETQDVKIDQFSVACMENDSGDFYHQWLIACDRKLDEVEIANIIDDHLKSVNKNYRVARNKALNGVKTRVVEEEKWYGLMEKDGNLGGQTKTPKVVNAETMLEYLKWLDKY